MSSDYFASPGRIVRRRGMRRTDQMQVRLVHRVMHRHRYVHACMLYVMSSSQLLPPAWRIHKT